MFRSLPLQQMLPSHQAAVQNLYDGVCRQPGLMWQKSYHDARAKQFIGRTAPAHHRALDAVDEALQQRRDGWNRNGQPHHQAPRARRGGNHPAGQ